MVWLKFPLFGMQKNADASWADVGSDTFVWTKWFDEFVTTDDRDFPTDFHVTLVHGTFASKTDWIEVDSLLARQLLAEGDRERINVTVHPFRWSGRNSFGARQQAAIELHEQLVGVINAHPDAAHCVIAHSHGGAVLMRALAFNPELELAIRRVICISTPFLQLSKRHESVEFGVSKSIHGLVILTLLMLALEARGTLPEQVIGGSPIMIAIGILIAFLVAIGISRTAVDRVLKLWREAGGKAIYTTQTPQLRRSQALLVRTAADEASFVLGMGATLAWMFERLSFLAMFVYLLPFHLIGRRDSGGRGLYKAIMMLGAIAALLIAAVFVLLVPIKPLTGAAQVVIGVYGAHLALASTASLFVFLSGLINVAFGAEIFAFAPFYKGTAEATPLGVWQIYNFPAMRMTPFGRLQHSYLYSACDTRAVLATWILTGTFKSRLDWRHGVQIRHPDVLPGTVS
jgi:hypothetical protein